MSTGSFATPRPAPGDAQRPPRSSAHTDITDPQADLEHSRYQPTSGLSRSEIPAEEPWSAASPRTATAQRDALVAGDHATAPLPPSTAHQTPPAEVQSKPEQDETEQDDAMGGSRGAERWHTGPGPSSGPGLVSPNDAQRPFSSFLPFPDGTLPLHHGQEQRRGATHYSWTSGYRHHPFRPANGAWGVHGFGFGSGGGLGPLPMQSNMRMPVPGSPGMGLGSTGGMIPFPHADGPGRAGPLLPLGRPLSPVRGQARHRHWAQAGWGPRGTGAMGPGGACGGGHAKSMPGGAPYGASFGFGAGWGPPPPHFGGPFGLVPPGMGFSFGFPPGFQSHPQGPAPMHQHPHQQTHTHPRPLGPAPADIALHHALRTLAHTHALNAHTRWMVAQLLRARGCYGAWADRGGGGAGAGARGGGEQGEVRVEEMEEAEGESGGRAWLITDGREETVEEVRSCDEEATHFTEGQAEAAALAPDRASITSVRGRSSVGTPTERHARSSRSPRASSRGAAREPESGQAHGENSPPVPPPILHDDATDPQHILDTLLATLGIDATQLTALAADGTLEEFLRQRPPIQERDRPHGGNGRGGWVEQQPGREWVGEVIEGMETTGEDSCKAINAAGHAR